MPFTYNDPILSRRRKGDSTDPFVLIEESIQVPEGATYQLTEIPSRLGRVTIPGLVEVQQMPPNGLKENEYYVDYVEGLVTVHPSKIGQTLINKYEGTGARFFPASRVWTEQRDGEVVKTLKDIIDVGNDAIEAIEKLDETLRKAKEATDEANEAADRVNTIADQVEEAENLRVIAEQERNNAEAERRSAENERIANENQRIANEQARESAEADRINEENIRISNENQRIANEQARIDAESVRADAEEIRKNNEDQRIANEQARENAEEDRIAAEEQRVINEQLREAAEAVRENAEAERVDNENQRIANEQTRENAEIARINAEAEREANELIRQQQEADRQANTAEAINNANQAAQNAQNLVDTSVHRGEFDINTQYQKNNHVRYNGSTWRALQDVKGVTPQEGEYWTLVAQRGLDGQGSVTTVNNKYPDLNGNVQLVPEDIGAENASNKGMPNGYAPLDETGNIPEEYLGNIESMEMHGNEWHTEEFETVQGAQAKANVAEQNAKAYTDEQIQLVTETGIPKLVSYTYKLIAESDDQTKFEIPLETFDSRTDTVLVFQNTTYVDPTRYTITNPVKDLVFEYGYITLNEGVSKDTEIVIVVLKNVPIGPEGSINGVVLAVDSVPADRIKDLNQVVENYSPIKSVNGKTGDVTLSASDVGAETPAGAQAKADAAEQAANLYTDQRIGEVEDDIKTPDPAYTPQRTINTAGDVTRDMQAQLALHKADKSNPHGVTTEQVNYIEPKNADEPPRVYPRGVTTFMTSTVSGYPEVHGTVLTYCYNQNRIVQHFTSLSGRPYYRVGVSDQWGEWKRLLNDDGNTFSTASVNYYVDVNGDDENNGSSQNPFRTIAKAVSMLPNIILRNHVIRIYLGEGVWDEEVNIEGINVLGRLEIRGTTTNPSNHVIDRLSVSKVLGEAWFLNFSTKKAIPYGTGSLEFSASFPHMYVENVEMIGATDGSEKGENGSINLLADRGSVVYVTNCTMSNRRYGIRSNGNSKVFSRDNTGTNNDFGVAARWGGIVQTYGTQPTGTRNDYSVDSGGIVVKPSGIILGD